MIFDHLNFEQIPDLDGCKGALTGIILARLANQPKITVLVVQSAQRALELLEQTQTWLGIQSHRAVCFLPERELIYDQTASDPDILSARIKALSMEKASGGLIITLSNTLLERHFEPNAWKKQCFEIKVDDELKRSSFIETLVDIGYQRVSVVEERGTFAIRGGLVDIFPVAAEQPYRLDFFGDEIESIKIFSPLSQRSIDKRRKLLITPANEFVADKEHIENIEKRVLKEISILNERRGELLSRKLDHFRANQSSRFFRELAPFIKAGEALLLDYWNKPRLILEEPQQLLEKLEEDFSRLENAFENLEETTPLQAPSSYYHKPGVVTQRLQETGYTSITRFNKLNEGFFKEIKYLDPPTDSSRETLIKDLRRLLEANWSVVIAIADEGRLNNLRGLLGERKIKLHSSLNPLALKAGSVLFLHGNGGRGFKDHQQKLAIFGEEDMFTGPARENVSKRRSTSQNLHQIEQMVPGDMVVHADHGIAEFRGTQTLTAGGNTREYLLLQYAGTDKLYVPTDQTHKLSKYLGGEGVIPKIHSLSSKAWINQKARVRKNVEFIARDLVELYADRIANKGFAFAPDCELMQKLEDNFPYIETPDQHKAIEAVKADMETEYPMDRLVCGDVGYGKTEVAMRAAFKAVCSGKQVAVLAPTTLLAFQHYQSFVRRFEGLGVRVDMVSRLRKAAEQKETLAQLKSGVLDVLIGTHRILSADINFKDLGLLIVDEEQRFGVKHKERLKKMKALVDVLTLTATPIPRTMQMAMSGVKQISVIDTPPRDRRPVHTYVSPFDAGWVKRAIIEELKRGGQIYYVYNRVESIERKAQFLRKLVPDARIAVGHGQMSEAQIEQTMLDFVKGDYDILLATTIIESGLDIPNVNTLIVDEAERLGLSQMYQLRGRVGRSARQAWAYFFYSKGKRLGKDAIKRLEVIEEHTALGSGFKIAMKDLQIRGAGNILGETQSGHIAGVGLSLYMELLEEAVERAKSGNRAYERLESVVEIPVTAYFPQNYISEEETRVELYSRLSRCRDLGLLDEIQLECEDRFGLIPKEAATLFTVSKLRIMALSAKVTKISRVINHLKLEFSKTGLPDIGKLFNTKHPVLTTVYFNNSEPNVINLNLPDDDPNTPLTLAETFLTLIS